MGKMKQEYYFKKQMKSGTYYRDQLYVRLSRKQITKEEFEERMKALDGGELLEKGSGSGHDS